MTMHLIIDAYNLLKTIERTHSLSRDVFIKILEQYSARKKHHVMVVFDGGPAPESFKERFGNITIFYSGIHKNADQIIKEVIDVYHDQKNVLVISTDMQLKHFAKLHNLIALDSELFAQFLIKPRIVKEKKVLRINGKAHKLQEQSEPEIDRLMESASQFANKDAIELESESKEDWLKEVAGNNKQLIAILRKL